MLALKSKLRLTLMLVGTFMLLGGSAFGQQTPSQRYQPVRGSEFQGPPSVHVPPQQMQKIPPTFRAGGTTQFNFSDQTMARANELRGVANPGMAQRGAVQQTSFQVDEKGEPIVPDILSGGATPVRQGTPQLNPQVAPQFKVPSQPTTGPASAPVVDEAPRRTPADFAAAMNQVRNNEPRIAPGELASQTQNISAQMAELRRRANERAAAEAQAADLAVKAAAEQQEIDRLAFAKRQAEAISAQRVAIAKAGADRQAEFLRQQAAKAAADRVAAENSQADRIAAQRAETSKLEAEIEATAEQAAKETMEVSASDFIGKLSANPESAPVAIPETAPTQDDNTAPKLVVKQAKQMENVPAVMQLARNNFASEPVHDEKVVPVSSQEQTVQSVPSIRLGAPALQVETFGPPTVGVNKPANYKVVVHNSSNSVAERILVGINMPQWVDIENINLTSGGKEITDGQNQARLVWSIDKIPGNSSQTITITAVPRKAEVFDVGVEWTLVPRVGTTNINVTEPKLEMNIAGPQEVLYGETALYHVTVRNPGTGAAENVIVMLPEALGGERATLGHIEAGKEKNFQVELLARTAGELNLIATAAADGNLKTSAERELTVRRANLNISLDGPGLKYAGSMAQYTVEISNSGDATANEIVTAVALPVGVKYVSGVESVKLIEGGMRWPVGTLEPGQTRSYKINCQLDTSGDLQLEVGARGKGDLAASSACLTTVETVADLVLSVADPKGPLPTGEEIGYTIKVQNRGSKAAKGVNLVMQFSDGIEPKVAVGLDYKIVPGEVKFAPIAQIEPGQEMSFKITAEAMKAGTHIFRAQLTCQDSDAREISEGTTRFFGETVQPVATANSTDDSGFGSNSFGTQIK